MTPETEAEAVAAIDAAREFVAELAAVGGDFPAVMERIEREVHARGGTGSRGAIVAMAAALAITFGECLPGPASTRPAPAGRDDREETEK